MPTAGRSLGDSDVEKQRPLARSAARQQSPPGAEEGRPAPALGAATPRSVSQPPRPPTHNSRGVAAEALRLRAPDGLPTGDRAPPASTLAVD
ncbi:hypothetical protein NN561_006518 [Cricetulus griseus]